MCLAMTSRGFLDLWIDRLPSFGSDDDCSAGVCLVTDNTIPGLVTAKDQASKKESS